MQQRCWRRHRERSVGGDVAVAGVGVGVGVGSGLLRTGLPEHAADHVAIEATCGQEPVLPRTLAQVGGRTAEALLPDGAGALELRGPQIAQRLLDVFRLEAARLHGLRDAPAAQARRPGPHQ